MTKNDDPRMFVAMMISSAIDKLAPHKNQRQLSKEMGFARPNMLSMIRTGAAQIPFARIPMIAAVLGIDPAALFKYHVATQWPEAEDVVEEIFGGVLTQVERDWITFFKEVGIVEPPRTAEKRVRLVQILCDEEWDDEEEGR